MYSSTIFSTGFCCVDIPRIDTMVVLMTFCTPYDQYYGSINDLLYTLWSNYEEESFQFYEITFWHYFVDIKDIVVVQTTLLGPYKVFSSK